MEHWLITGGAGFIGSNFVNLIARDSSPQITVLDALTYAGNLQSIDSLIVSRRIRFCHGNVCDKQLVDRLFAENQITHVVHFAAESHVDRSILGAEEFIRTNVLGTFSMLEAARRHWKGEDKRLFVHVSTDEVFGDLALNAPAASESNSYAPSSPYSASKAASDHLVRAWHRTYGLPTVITNCSNNYGPWQFPEKLLPLIICNALENKPLPVYGDGQNIRDWLHVDDHCEAIRLVLRRGIPGETYLIGGRNERKNLDIVLAICSIVDQLLGRAEGSTRQLITFVSDRPGHDRRYSIDPTKIERELGWRPSRNFENSLLELVCWYRDHAPWIDAIRSGSYRDYYKRQYEGRA